ncbi:MAG: lysophospholipase [Cohaesibacter sp.]|nr:lysophospholipase [Cohaesibacter sp.]
MEIPGPLGPLVGRYIEAAVPDAPIAILIPGSGPTDMDGNNPLGVQARPYLLLAQALADQSIASLRIDKRGLFASAGAIDHPNHVLLSDYVHDIENWATALQKQKKARCVWLIGHSEGGLVALSAAQKLASRDLICGVVLLASPGRPLAEILRVQLQANPANAVILDEALSVIERLEAGQRVAMHSHHRALQILFSESVQPYLIDLMGYDPAKMIANLHCPVLIVQGSADLQIGLEDARRLKYYNDRAKMVILPDVNHVLKSVSPSKDRTANLASYTDPNLPVSDKLVDLVVDFITNHKNRHGN